MARRGRKAEAGVERQPCGRKRQGRSLTSSAAQIRIVMDSMGRADKAFDAAIELAGNLNPHQFGEIYALAKRYRTHIADPRLNQAAGRMLLAGSITQAQYQACLNFEALYRNGLRSICAPSSGNGGLTDRIGGNPVSGTVDPDQDAKAMARYKDAMKHLAISAGLSFGAVHRFLGITIRNDLEITISDDLRAIMQGMAEYMGLVRIRRAS